MMNNIKILVLIALAYVILSCAGTSPPPKLLDSQKGAIGICVETVAPVNIMGAQCADMVYFIRLEDDDSLNNVHYCLQSNYCKGDNIYLLNAKPGRYAAVASYYVQSGTLYSKDSKYTTMFPMKIIELTQTTVSAGKMAFMGKYLVDQAVGISDDADDAILHYIQVIAPGKSTDWLGGAFSYDNFYEGTLRKSSKDKQTEKLFLTDAKDQFKNTNWANLVQISLNELK